MKKIFFILLFSVSAVFAQIDNSAGTSSPTFQIGYDSTASVFVGMPTDTSVHNAITIYDGGKVGSKTYVPGWQSGSGWKLDYDDSTKEYSLTVDNMTIRGTLAVYEFLINQIRATNGNLLVTASTMVDSVDYGGNFFFADSASGNGLAPFQAGDLIMCQKADMSGATYDVNGNIVINKFLLKRFIFKVDSVNTLKVYVSLLAGAPTNVGAVKKGDVFIRFGNLNNSNSGMIGLYSDEQYSPYMRITDSVNSWSAWKSPSSIKAQIGKLNGLSNPMGSPLSGYGIYANRFYFYGDTNNYLAYNGNSFTSRISGHDIGTSITQNDSSINLISENVFSTQYNTLDTNWTLSSQSWSSNGDGLKSRLLDSVFTLRSGININSDSIRLFSSKIVQTQNNIATNTASITLNSKSITSLFNSTSLLTDSLYSYGTLIMQNKNNITLSASKYTNGDTLISYINLSPDSLKLSSRHINIDGYTTFGSGYNPSSKVPYSDTSNFANHINWNTTTINGGKLTTGTVIADSIRSSYLYSKTLIGGTITGSIFQTAIGSGQRVVIDTTNQIRFQQGSYEADFYMSGGLVHLTEPFTVIGYISSSAGLFTAGGNFSVDDSGRITYVHNVAASSDTNNVLRSDGTSFTPSHLNFSNLNGAVTTAQTNLSSTGTAPTINSIAPAPVIYGSNGAVLTTPTTWIQIKVGSTTYKVPAY